MFKKVFFKEKMTLALWLLCMPWSMSAQVWQNKVHESVFEQLRQHKNTDFLVIMSQEADLSGAQLLQRKPKKDSSSSIRFLTWLKAANATSNYFCLKDMFLFSLFGWSMHSTHGVMPRLYKNWPLGLMSK